MQSVTIDPGLDYSDLPGDPQVQHLVDAILQRRRGIDSTSPTTPEPRVYWPAQVLAFERIGAFAAASEAQQRTILEAFSSALLRDAYYGEKLGIASAAKCVLLAESLEERKLYGLFASDEVAHLEMFARFYRPASSDEWKASGFARAAGDALTSLDRIGLQLIVQVMLEGYLLAHYRALRDACIDPSLRDTFGAILQDEAAHHGSGLLLLREHTLDERGLGAIEHVASALLELFQLGPILAVCCIEREVGGFARHERLEAIRAIGALERNARCLAGLRALLEKTDVARPLVARLEAKGAFVPIADARLSEWETVR